MKEPTDGMIISNIPNVDLAPSFYLTPMTRLTTGFGYYKYYYRFNPIQIGDFGFNLNNEGYAIYSNISVCQSFDFRSYKCSITLKCFGLTRTYDRGLQFSFGLAL